MKGVALIALALVALVMSGDAGPVITPPPATSIPAGTSLAVAMVVALQVVIAIYLALNVAFLRIVPIAEMAGDPFVAATVARRLFGPSAIPCCASSWSSRRSRP